MLVGAERHRDRSLAACGKMLGKRAFFRGRAREHDARAVAEHKSGGSRRRTADCSRLYVAARLRAQ